MAIPYWRLSSFYFFYFTTVGSFIPYWSLYLKYLDFNAAEIGELTALLICTKIISPNLWGWIADRTGKSLRIIRWGTFFSSVLFAGFLVFRGYVWFAWLTVSFSFFWNATLPQFEAVTLQHLKAEPERYSQIRVWGSIGFIAAVLGIGYVIDGAFIAHLPAMIVVMLAVIWLMSLTIPDAQLSRQSAQTAGVWHILTRPSVIAFLLVSLLVQLAHAPYYVFYSLYLKQAHYAAVPISLLWSLGVVAEIVLFIYMRPVLKHISLRAVLLSSLFLSILRWLLIAYYVDNLMVLLMAQLLHAASFAGTHVAAVHLVYEHFGEQHQGKGQALYTSLSFGLGGMLGSLYAGYYWDSLGAEFVFLVAAFCCALALLIAYLWVGRENAQQSTALR